MTRHEAFRRFLSEVLTQADAEPAEPAELPCRQRVLCRSTEMPQGGTGGTAQLANGLGSTPHAGRPLPRGTDGTVATDGFQRLGSAVPQFQHYAQPCKIEDDEHDCDESERSAMASVEGQVPAVYAMAFARLQMRRPTEVHSWAWERAINDAGLFLDEWGLKAERFGWTANDLFAAPITGTSPGGLTWCLEGHRVVALWIRGAILSQGLRDPYGHTSQENAQPQTKVWLRA
jgi:hypothetical protein